MAPMLRGITLISVLALAVSVLWAAPASAHPALEIVTGLPPAATPPATMEWSSAPTPPAVPWPAMLAIAAVLVITWRRPRRALALAIVLILGVFAFENGLHSVHHLGDPRHLDDLRAGSTCSVAAATAHLAGTPVDGTTPQHLVLRAQERVVLPQLLGVEASCLTAHQGRAPPISA
jgi:hypothetical protein